MRDHWLKAYCSPLSFLADAFVRRWFTRFHPKLTNIPSPVTTHPIICGAVTFASLNVQKSRG